MQVVDQTFGYKEIDNNIVDAGYPVQKKGITEDTSFVLSNFVDGNKVTVLVKNLDNVAHTATFVRAGIDPSDAVKTIAPNSYTLYNLTAGAEGVFVCICSENSSGPFPSGDLGDLTILNGETVTINAGSIYDYNDIDIQTGGTLVIDDVNNEANLTEIYAKHFTIDGQIVGRSLLVDTNISKTVTNGLGTTISYNYAQKNGGNGGGGGASLPASGYGGGAGGTGTTQNGAGGGGGSAQNQKGGPNRYGGAGGSGNGSGGAGANSGGSGGSGNTYTTAGGSNQNGGNGYGGGGGGGGHGYNSQKNYNGYAGGGGGGAGGSMSGVPLFLYCENEIIGAGVIDLSGKNGLSGGHGGNRVTSGNIMIGGGGGGGGGAGGSGGFLFIKAPMISVAYNIVNGTGGSGGAGGSGWPNSSGYGVNGSTGGTGQAGNNGTFTQL